MKQRQVLPAITLAAFAVIVIVAGIRSLEKRITSSEQQYVSGRIVEGFPTRKAIETFVIERA